MVMMLLVQEVSGDIYIKPGDDTKVQAIIRG
jgi:hypothetical protein